MRNKVTPASMGLADSCDLRRQLHLCSWFVILKYRVAGYLGWWFWCHSFRLGDLWNGRFLGTDQLTSVSPVDRSVESYFVATKTNRTQAGACAPRFLSWELHADCFPLKKGLKRFRALVVVKPLTLFLANDCARHLICGISGLRKDISDRNQGFAATAHQAPSIARADSFGRRVSPIKQC